MLSTIIGVVTRHFIKSVLTMRIELGNLANDFCSSCRYEEEKNNDSSSTGSMPGSMSKEKETSWCILNRLHSPTWVMQIRHYGGKKINQTYLKIVTKGFFKLQIKIKSLKHYENVFFSDFL